MIEKKGGLAGAQKNGPAGAHTRQTGQSESSTAKTTLAVAGVKTHALSTLDELAETVREEHNEALGAARIAIRHAVAAGDALAKAKAELKHGEYTAWIEDRCGLNQRTARRYAQVARLSASGCLDEEFLLTGSVRQATAPSPDPTSDTTSETPVDANRTRASVLEKSTPDKPKPATKLTTGERVAKTIEDGKELFGSILNDVQRVRRDIKRLSAEEMGIHISLQRTDAGMVSAYQALKFAMPFARCCYCAKSKGEQGGCRACKKKGWLSRGLHRDAPKKLREMAAK